LLSTIALAYVANTFSSSHSRFIKLETARYVYAKGGIRGFYRGLGPTILGYLPTWAIYFTVYDSVKEYFGEEALGATKRVADRMLTAGFARELG
jgi:hypothetical protein